MGKIYLPPTEIPAPEFDWTDIEGYQAKEKKFVDDLRNFVNPNNDIEHVGEVIGFPVADGTAQYMVASLKPVTLIYLPLVDKYEFQYADKLSAKDIIDKIKQKKALDELFSKNK